MTGILMARSGPILQGSGLATGTADGPLQQLNPAGIAHAKKLGRYITEIVETNEFEHLCTKVYHAHSGRAEATAKLAIGEFPDRDSFTTVPLDGMQEFDYGHFTGSDRASMQKLFRSYAKSAVETFQSENPSKPLPSTFKLGLSPFSEVEKADAVVERNLNAMLELSDKHLDEFVVVIAHAGPQTQLINYFTGIEKNQVVEHYFETGPQHHETVALFFVDNEEEDPSKVIGFLHQFTDFSVPPSKLVPDEA